MQSSYMLPPNKSTSGFGVAGLVLGSVALVICWIPLVGCFSLPVAILGLIFGLVGLIVAISGKRHGIGMPIAGSAVSIVALLGFAAMSFIWGAAARSVVQQAAKQQQSIQLTAPVTATTESSPTSQP